MHDRDWNDDTDYESAVRRTQIMMAIASVVTLLVLGAVAIGIFGVSVLLDLMELFGR
ncbi:hypothetical protein ACFQ7A_29370 [Streptomyces sp. NPDC056528]|uniref:hypothetical protein n=1 Tax=Streptomyces sp. NPDC056528 TaxID=3345854 RepID=UPI00368290AC